MPQRPLGLLRKIGRAVEWVLLAILGVFATIAAYHTLRSHQEAKMFPPPGKLVDIGGRRLHLYCTGSGSPAVILNAGQGSYSNKFGLVQPKVAAFTQVCSYDRAGLGWSDISTVAPDSKAATADLHALLGAAKIAPPYILAGHSSGAFDVRVYSHSFPNEVAGIVLIDGTIPEAYYVSYAKISTREMCRRDASEFRTYGWLARLGLVRVRYALTSKEDHWSRSLLDKDREAYEEMRVQASRFEADAREIEAFPDSIEQAHAITTLGAIPLTLIWAGGPFDQEELEWHRQTLALSSNSREIVATGSSHAVHLERPDLVSDAIRQLTLAARQ